jgi:hypothetical protein
MKLSTAIAHRRNDASNGSVQQADRTRLVRVAFLLVTLTVMTSPAFAQARSPATATVFEATFDAGASPEVSRGLSRIIGNAEIISDGYESPGLRGTERTFLNYLGAASDLDEERGRIECWLRPRWQEREKRQRLVFEITFDDKHSVALNRDALGQFGFGITYTHQESQSRVHQLRTLPWRGLESGAWHHIELVWTPDYAEFRIDGVRIATQNDPNFEFGQSGDIRIRGSNFDIDRIRIESGERGTSESDPGRVVEAPTAPISTGFVEDPQLDRLGSFAAEGELPIDWREKPLLAEFDPSRALGTPSRQPLQIDLARSHSSRRALVIAAGTDLENVRVDFEPFVDAGGEPVALEARAHRIVRTWERKTWNGPPEDLAAVSRFITPWRARDIDAGQAHEVWLEVDQTWSVPAGSYSGGVRFRSNRHELRIPMTVSIVEYPLDADGPKKLGIYYFLEDKLFDPEEIRRELADLRKHGIRHLVTDIEIQHGPADQNYTAQVDMAQRGLRLIRDAGFEDLVVIQNGLERVMKWRAREFSDGIANDRVFGSVIDRSMQQINALVGEFPMLDIYQTHLDEVFSAADRLDQYIDIARHAQRRSEVPFYITLNTRFRRSNDMRRRLDPFVEFRAFHGYTFEWWLARGNRVVDMQRELESSGDRALFYHNARGTYFTAMRSRVINGVLLWAGPFESHAPWIYQRYDGNPFDDRDGKRHDYGMAFPGPGGTVVGTRIWEGLKEGWIDLRHLQTLKRLVGEKAATHPVEVAAAQETLRTTRALVVDAEPNLRNNFAGLRKNDRGGLYIDYPGSAQGAAEAPLLSALEREFGDSGLDTLRSKLALHIRALSEPPLER